MFLLLLGAVEAHVLGASRAAAGPARVGASPTALATGATATSSLGAAAAAADEAGLAAGLPKRDLACRYDYLQFFVDELQSLSHYKAIEDRLNELARRVPAKEGMPVDVAAAREEWCRMGPSADPDGYEVHGRDLVEQMLYGFGWRITAQHEGHQTRSLMLSTVDPAGARFIVTCARARRRLRSLRRRLRRRSRWTTLRGRRWSATLRRTTARRASPCWASRPTSSTRCTRGTRLCTTSCLPVRSRGCTRTARVCSTCTPTTRARPRCPRPTRARCCASFSGRRLPRATATVAPRPSRPPSRAWCRWRRPLSLGYWPRTATTG